MNAAAGVETGAWIALSTDTQPWLRVDFTANVTLTAVATQGRGDSDEWVTSFKLSFSVDSNYYEHYGENGVSKVQVVFSQIINAYSSLRRMLPSLAGPQKSRIVES